MDQTKQTRMMVFGLLCASTSLFFGFEVGLFNSFFQTFVKTEFGITDPEKQNKMKGTVSFLFLFGGTICSLTAGQFYQKVGLYKALMMMIVCSGATCFMFIMNSMLLIYIARFIGGYLSCLTGLLPPLLIKRHLPETEANSIMPSVYIFLTFGILLSYLICVPENVAIWKFIFLFPLLFLIPLFIILNFWFPEESLVVPDLESKDPLQEGLEMRSREHSGENGSDAYQENYTGEIKKEADFADLFSPEFKNQMTLAIFLNVANQVTGINFLIFYSTDIFTKVNLPNPPLWTFLMGFVNFSGGVFLTFYLKRFSKRDVMLWGLIGQSAFMFSVVFGLMTGLGLFVLLGCYGFIFSFAISLGGQLGPYVVDFVPASGFGLTGLPQWILACIIGKFAIEIMEFLGYLITFSILAFVAAFCAFYFAGSSIQTEGKSMEMIKKEFMQKKFME